MGSTIHSVVSLFYNIVAHFQYVLPIGAVLGNRSKIYSTIPTIYWSYYKPKVIKSLIRHNTYRNKYNAFFHSTFQDKAVYHDYTQDYPDGYIIGTWNIILSIGSTI